MKVLVDTSVWSRSLCRQTLDAVSKKLIELILTSQVVLIAPVRQELLSVLSDEKIFHDLKSRLEPFDDLLVTTSDYETAAQFFNICRSHGVQGSHIDVLICAIATNDNLHISLTDKDFERFAMHFPIRLFEHEAELSD